MDVQLGCWPGTCLLFSALYSVGVIVICFCRLGKAEEFHIFHVVLMLESYITITSPTKASGWNHIAIFLVAIMKRYSSDERNYDE